MKVRMKDTGPPLICFVPATMGWARRMPEPNVFRQPRNFLICFEITAKREVCQISVPAWQCQPHGKVAVFRHTMRSALEAGTFCRTTELRRCTATMQNGARFRAYAFSTGAWIASFQDVP